MRLRDAAPIVEFRLHCGQFTFRLVLIWNLGEDILSSTLGGNGSLTAFSFLHVHG